MRRLTARSKKSYASDRSRETAARPYDAARDDGEGTSTGMRIGIPRETAPRERRVALVPAAVARLRSKLTSKDADDDESNASAAPSFAVESDAGKRAFFADDAYSEAGAEIVPSFGDAAQGANLVLKVQPPTFDEVEALPEGCVLVGFQFPHLHLDVIRALAGRGITTLAMDWAPRITRAQSMDALSSMSTIAGYKAVLRAANSLGKLFPMLVTAAGTLTPAKVLILGAGVAGLQAIATARRLGAIVEAFDVRPAAKEQVESLGAKFLAPPSLDKSAEDSGGYAKALDEETEERNRAVIAEAAAQADVVISTALIPGRPAPVLLTEDAVRGMNPGSVIVDLAVEMGGNCTLSEAAKEVVHHGVVIIGPVNLPSTAPTHASEMYSRNLSTLCEHIVQSGKLEIDLADEITGAMCVTHDGEICREDLRQLCEEERDSA